MADPTTESIAAQNAQPQRLSDALDIAWGLIANVSGGTWGLQLPAWENAAHRFREQYIALAKTDPAHATRRFVEWMKMNHVRTPASPRSCDGLKNPFAIEITMRGTTDHAGHRSPDRTYRVVVDGLADILIVMLSVVEELTTALWHCVCWG